MTTLKLFDNISRKTDVLPRLGYGLFWLALFVATLGAGNNAYAAIDCTGKQKITANVVVFDSPTVFNRLGAQNPNWITYALKRDVVNSATGVPCSTKVNGADHCQAGNVELRSDKRPRPLVVRSVEGACLDINFTNYLAPAANSKDPQQGRKTPGTLEPDFAPFDGLDNNDQVVGRCASFHATGTELRESMADDGAVVGSNDHGSALTGTQDCGTKGVSGLVKPGDSHTYKLYTPHEGAFIINSYGATIGSEANSGNLAVGMFGALNVQPKGARIYRSQMTEEEFRLAININYQAVNCANGNVPAPGHTCFDQPVIDYEAIYPPGEPWASEGKAGLPIVNMLTPTGELVHSDINAIIAGPDTDGSWRSVCAGSPGPDSDCPYPLESVGKRNPAYPNRLEAFREFTSQYHDEQTNSQVFPNWYANPVMQHVLHGVKDQFMINYGSGGIGSEIIANRLRTGPMHDCTDCAYEEFFLASQTVGDPALLVNMPANTGIEACSPTNLLADETTPGGNSCWRIPATEGLANGPIRLDDGQGGFIENYALYQEDPSNVHHAYTGDPVKMRNTHAGSFEQHIFHFHNHQWLFNPNDDNANYLDAQEIMPGSGHTYELVYGGAGNRNHTVGDAIFHCHFYPHFAQGMWYHMRNHDVYETGTVLNVSGGTVDNPGYHTDPFELRSGQPMQGSRAYPDGELPDGSPIPAIIPLPGAPMPMMPAKVEIMAVDRGSYTLLGGRGPKDGIPDSSQAVVDRDTIGTVDDPVSPGYPFWLAGNECGIPIKDDPDTEVNEANDCPQGIVGQRMPTPPLDMLTDHAAATLDPSWAKLGGGWDGGLPRHALLGYTSAGVSADTSNRLDFRKVVHMAQPVYFPEAGTDLEAISMAYQATPRPGFKSKALQLKAAGDPTGEAGDPKDGYFEVNGAPAVPGGPFNDPCIDDKGDVLGTQAEHKWFGGNGPWTRTDGDDLSFIPAPASQYDAHNPRTYKLANLQIDAVFNKVGYHYAQERIIILWEDVKDTVNKVRPPEPLVMRFNTFDCGKILHANLVPAEFEVDDFQVRTPTDIIGQHIHLPKWDLTTNDGAANGWNYEDGTLSPGMVHERALAINHFNLLVQRCIDKTGPCELPGTVFESYKFVDDEGNPHDLKNIAPINLAGLVPVETLPNACGDVSADPLAPPQSVDANKCGTPGGLVKLNDHLEHYFGGFKDTGNPQVGAGMYKSTRTTIQRLLVDPVFNVSGVDRGLGLTFSHDHYGPSTFQQIGLYSTILAEPAGSTWKHNETGMPLNTRHDGGPTSWQAVIETPDPDPDTYGNQNPVPDHREFYFEMSDFQHAYEADTLTGAGYYQADKFGIPRKFQVDDNGEALKEIQILGAPLETVPFLKLDATVATADEIKDTWIQVVNPTLKLTAGGGNEAQAFPDTVNAHPNCPGRLGQNDPGVPRPCGEAINIGHASMWVVNYRNEPIGLRVFDPSKLGPDGRKGTQAGGLNENGEFINPQAGDLALAFQSRNDRAISALNKPLGCLDGSCLDPTPAYPQASYCQGTGDGINCDRNSGDPFTPIMRAYEHDHVKVKIQVGATEEQHQTTIHGVKWLSNGSGFGRSPNSGWRNFQSHGISEQFSLQMPIIPDRQNRGNVTDYLYATDATRDGIWGGTWGILRSYQNGRNDLYALPNNPMNGSANVVNNGNFTGVCPKFVMDENGDAIGEGKGKNSTLVEVPVKKFEVFAVRANHVLPNNLNVGILDNVPAGPRAPGFFANDNEGGPLDPNGGTLVYNRRAPDIGICDAGFAADGVQCADDTQPRMVAGPLNDPTALMYVLEEDLEPRFIAGVSPDEDGWRWEPDDTDKVDGGTWVRGYDYIDDRCQDVKDNGDVNLALHRAGCPVKLRADAPVEPLVLRAEAGDCIEATLWNKLADQATITRGTGANAEKKLVYVGSNTGTPVFSDVVGNKGNLVDEDNTPLTEADMAAIEYDVMPDLAGWQDTFWVVNRDLFKPAAERLNPDPTDPAVPPQMSFFGNNLIRPSAMAGLHAQLVEYDASQDDGVVVGQNPQSIIAGPGEQHTYRWYAGHIDTKFTGMSGKGKNQKRDFLRLVSPIEFGGANVLSADRIKQPQKGLFAALVIEPKGAKVYEDTRVADGQMGCVCVPDPDDATKCLLDRFGNTQCKVDAQGVVMIDEKGTRPTRAQVTVDAGPAGDAGQNGKYRETVAVTHKITNLRWADGSTVKNVGQAEFGVEGAEDSGHAGYNYGTEPSWFRFELQPDADTGNANAKSYGGIPNPQAMYANSLVAGQLYAIPDIPGVAVAGDPQTPVFRTTADPANPVFDTRMHVLNGASADRDSTYILHGHVWQRDPFVCTGAVLLPGGKPGQYWVPPGASDEDPGVALTGRCSPDAFAPSNALGLNRQAKYMGGEEGMGHVFGHWPILFDAGGTGAITGDYLFRDYAPNGNRNGMFGILRVEPKPPQP